MFFQRVAAGHQHVDAPREEILLLHQRYARPDAPPPHPHAEPAQDRRGQQRGKGFRHCQRDLVDRQMRAFAHFVDHRARRGQQLARAFVQRASRGGQPQRAQRTVEQRRAQARLKPGDGLRYGRLGDPQLRSAGRHPAKLDRDDKHFQRVKIEFRRQTQHRGPPNHVTLSFVSFILIPCQGNSRAPGGALDRPRTMGQALPGEAHRL